MGDRFIDNPLVQSAVVPLLVALLGSLTLGRVAGPRTAVAAVPLGLFAGLVSIQGWPAWPAIGSGQKLAWLLPGSIVVGGALGAFVPQRRSRVGALAGAWVLGLVWLAWPLLRSGRIEVAVSCLALALGGGVCLYLLDRAGPRSIEAPLMGLVAAAGLASIGLSGASASLAQLAGALAAATGGFLLCNWPALRHPFAPVGAGAVGLPLFFLVVTLQLYTDASSAALGLVGVAFVGSEVARRLPWFADPPRPLVDRLAFVALCAVPVGLAAWIAWLGESTDSVY